MQDKYVGDIGDYAKLILLRFLNRGSTKLGVVWCKNEGSKESNNDGKHRSYRAYLGKHSLRHCDEELFDGFAEFDSVENRRIERLHRYIPNADFYADSITIPRSTWIIGALDSTLSSELVFFDPDNGIAFGCQLEATSNKHVSLDELRRFWGRGQSILVYHHLTRRKGGHELHIREMKSTLTQTFHRCSVHCIHIRRGTHVSSSLLHRSTTMICVNSLSKALRR